MQRFLSVYIIKKFPEFGFFRLNLNYNECYNIQPDALKHIKNRHCRAIRTQKKTLMSHMYVWKTTVLSNESTVQVVSIVRTGKGFEIETTTCMTAGDNSAVFTDQSVSVCIKFQLQGHLTKVLTLQSQTHIFHYLAAFNRCANIQERAIKTVFRD